MKPKRRPRFRRDLTLFVLGAIITVLAALITLTPQDLGARLRSWGALLAPHYLPLATGFFFCFSVVFLILYITAIRAHRDTARCFASLFESRQVINEILRSYARQKKPRRIQILAATGGAIFPILKEQLLHHASLTDLTIDMLVVDWESPAFDRAAAHWRQEAEAIAGRLGQLAAEVSDRRIQITVRRYQSISMIHGLLFDNEHLFFGLFHWMPEGGGGLEMVGAEMPYLYVTRRQGHARMFFNTFTSWYERLAIERREPALPASEGPA